MKEKGEEEKGLTNNEEFTINARESIRSRASKLIPKSQKNTTTKSFLKWTTVILYLIIFTFTVVLSVPLSAFNKSVSVYYKITPAQISLASSIKSLVSLLIVFPANYILTKMDVKKTTILGTLSLGVGCLFMAMINSGFDWFVLGSAVCGLGAPLVRISHPVFCAQWFNPKAVSNSVLGLYWLG